ncbi:MAG: DUF2480 family protein [Bacteroidetes bacterium]|jgi:hypothetical protein|tara:strand:- start:8454 stop:8966 length:513 start_codon:yes stop_codon:yes gene_type:complete
MSKEIINRVANSKLETIDLESFISENERETFDLKKWLKNDLVLIEKDFRENAQNYNWKQHKNKFISIVCSNDAIIPDWAFLLISSFLKKNEIKHVIGSLELLENLLINEAINNYDFSNYQNKTVIIKGCSGKFIPKSSYSALIEKLQPIAKSILFGEACSSVPIYKYLKK